VTAEVVVAIPTDCATWAVSGVPVTGSDPDHTLRSAAAVTAAGILLAAAARQRRRPVTE
jgi:MYXO-CTERM domain-containing protein